MGGICYKHGESHFPLTAFQLVEQEDVFGNPEITEKTIQDKSKREWFAKGVAALQVSQLALSLIVRTNQGLAFSQLEAITLGFAVCGALIYLVYLYKPQNAGTPFTVAVQRTEEHHLRDERTYDSFWALLTNKRTGAAHNGKADRISNDNILISRSSSAHSAIPLLAFASGLLGAMHAIAWNFEFPTVVERILWQMATVVAAGSPVTGLITILFCAVDYAIW
jgi:hypothetical protein